MKRRIAIGAAFALLLLAAFWLGFTLKSAPETSAPGPNNWALLKQISGGKTRWLGFTLKSAPETSAPDPDEWARLREVWGSKAKALEFAAGRMEDAAGRIAVEHGLPRSHYAEENPWHWSVGEPTDPTPLIRRLRFEIYNYRELAAVYRKASRGGVGSAQNLESKRGFDAHRVAHDLIREMNEQAAMLGSGRPQAQTLRSSER